MDTSTSGRCYTSKLLVFLPMTTVMYRNSFGASLFKKRANVSTCEFHVNVRNVNYCSNQRLDYRGKSLCYPCKIPSFRVLLCNACCRKPFALHNKTGHIKKKKKCGGGATLISYTHATLKSHVKTSCTPVFLSVVLSAQWCCRSGCVQCGRGPLVADFYHLLSSFFVFLFFFNVRPAFLAESVKVVYFRKQGPYSF